MTEPAELVDLRVESLHARSPGVLRGMTWIAERPFVVEFMQVQPLRGLPHNTQWGATDASCERLRHFDRFLENSYCRVPITIPNYPGEWLMVIYPAAITPPPGELG